MTSKVSLVGVGDRIRSYLHYMLDAPLTISNLTGEDQLFELLERDMLETGVLVLGDELEDPLQLAACLHSLDERLPIVILSEGIPYTEIEKSLRTETFLNTDIKLWPLSRLNALPAALILAMERTQFNQSTRTPLAEITEQTAATAAMQLSPGTAVPDPLNALNSVEQIFHQASLGIVTIDRHENVLRFNAMSTQLLALPKTEQQPHQLYLDQLLPPGEYAKVQGILDYDGSINADRSVIITLEDAFSQTRHLELSVHHVSGIVTSRNKTLILKDVTETIESAQIVADEQKRHRATLCFVRDGVVSTDPGGIIDYMNPVAEELAGVPLYEARGQFLDTIFRIIDVDSRERLANPVSACLDQNRQAALSTTPCILLGRSGTEHLIESSATPVWDRYAGIQGAVWVFKDVSETARLAQQISYQASHDILTGLINRQEFEKRVEVALASARRHQVQHALCYLDLDQFKIINAHAGHAAGDVVLKQVASLLADKIRSLDTLARLGGDEFCLLLVNCTLDRAVEVAEGLVAAVRGFRFTWEERRFEIAVSVGVVAVNSNTEDVAELMTQADLACYTAKDLGRNRIHIYRSEDAETVKRHTEMLRAAGVSDALKEDRFRLYCQPIVSLTPQHSDIIHYELLIRLLDDKGGVLLPAHFIPAAERYGLMSIIDRWVISTACQSYRRTFGTDSNTEIAINLSGNSLNDETMVAFIEQELATSGIAANRVCFEITETAAIGNLAQASELITRMKQIGCRFALDDFGSGLSSFTYLKNLPVDYLKIDGSFVLDMVDDNIDHAMVEAINQVGHVMDIRTIAECAETGTVVEQLRELGVDYAQGYAMGRPVPLDEVKH